MVLVVAGNNLPKPYTNLTGAIVLPELKLGLDGLQLRSQPLASNAVAVLPSSYSTWSRHPDLPVFRSSITPPTNASGLRFKRHLTMTPARLEVRMDSLLPFLQGTCTPYNMPVYPGARRKTG